MVIRLIPCVGTSSSHPPSLFCRGMGLAESVYRSPDPSGGEVILVEMVHCPAGPVQRRSESTEERVLTSPPSVFSR